MSIIITITEGYLLEIYGFITIQDCICVVLICNFSNVGNIKILKMHLDLDLNVLALVFIIYEI